MFKVIIIKTRKRRRSEYYKMDKIKLAPFSSVFIVKLEQVTACWEENNYNLNPSTAETN